MMKLLALLGLVGGLNVLISTSFGGRSHARPLLEMANTLALRGHRIAYVALEDNLRFAAPYNVTRVSLGSKHLLAEGAHRLLMEPFADKRGAALNHGFWKAMRTILPLCYGAEFARMDAYVGRGGVDVMVCDFLSVACRDIAQHRGIPLVVGVQSIDGMKPSLAPEITNTLHYAPLSTRGMTLRQRFVAKFLASIDNAILFYPLLAAVNRQRAEHGIGEGPFVDFTYGPLLANTFFGFETPRPLPPYVHMAGPIASPHAAPLPAELLRFLQAHSRTLYVGFGSLTALSRAEVAAIVGAAQDAIAAGHIDAVLWGLGHTPPAYFPEAIRNNRTAIRILTWAPQVAILNHRHTRLFLSHGGLDSTFEAIHAATPVLCMPFFGDQPRNARKVEEMGIGIHIPHDAIPQALARAIPAALSGPSFQANLLRARHIARPAVNGADMLEAHANLARACRSHFPASSPPCEMQHLTPHSESMPFFPATNLDIVILLTLAALLLIGSLVSMPLRLMRRSLGSSPKLKLL